VPPRGAAVPVEQPQVTSRELHLPHDKLNRLVRQFTTPEREPPVPGEELQPHRQRQPRRPGLPGHQHPLVLDQRPVLDQLVFVQRTRHSRPPAGERGPHTTRPTSPPRNHANTGRTRRPPSQEPERTPTTCENRQMTSGGSFLTGTRHDTRRAAPSPAKTQSWWTVLPARQRGRNRPMARTRDDRALSRRRVHHPLPHRPEVRASDPLLQRSRAHEPLRPRLPTRIAAPAPPDISTPPEPGQWSQWEAIWRRATT
jgi:hypothetical protein